MEPVSFNDSGVSMHYAGSHNICIIMINLEKESGPTSSIAIAHDQCQKIEERHIHSNVDYTQHFLTAPSSLP